jgi:hypothetical protein
MITAGALKGNRDEARNIAVLAIAGLVGFNLGLALTFDYPFSGDISISNKNYYEGILSQFSDNDGHGTGF